MEDAENGRGGPRQAAPVLAPSPAPPTVRRPSLTQHWHSGCIKPMTRGHDETTGGWPSRENMMTILEETCPEAPGTVQVDPLISARAAGLRYVTDAMPGIRRRRSGKGFTYRGPDDQTIRDEATLARIRSLAIPPAWTDVWICPNPRGHIQATGRDAKGRKQYRYHPQWHQARDVAKYDRMIAFAEALPRIRERTDRDLELRGLPRAKVLAVIVRLLEETHIRIGNEAYRRQNRSFGLTTLRDQHVDVVGATLRFHFRGKSGKTHNVTLRDRRLAGLVKRCQQLPGQELFQYVDEHGARHTIASDDVNDYLREISGSDFTAKDFRTWAGTMLAARLLRQEELPETATRRRQQVTQAIKRVAERLGNTPSVCRKCYVHPGVIEAFEAGELPSVAEAMLQAPEPESPYALSNEEQALLTLLHEQAAEALEEETTRPRRSSRAA